MTEQGAERVLYLVDGTSNIFRAFYAIRGLSDPSGRPTNATFGFTQMLRKLLQDKKPTFIAVAFDRPEPTHRHLAFPSYKANRQAPPEDLIEQIPDIKEVCRVLGIPQVEMAGFEADDLMGTLARKAVEDGFRVVLVSSDKDLLQLVNDSVQVLHPSRGELLDREGVKRSFGVYPEQVVDVLALMGDSSDNVPGVPGIGEKGARDLVVTYGSLEECLRHASEISRKTYRENLLKHGDQARKSRELVTIHGDVPMPWQADQFRRGEMQGDRARQLFSDLGFNRIVEEMRGAQESGASEAPVPLGVPMPVKRLRQRGEWEEFRQTLLAHRKAALVPWFSASEPMHARLLGLALGESAETVHFADLQVEPQGQADDLGEAEIHQELESVLQDPSISKLSDDLKSLEVYLLRRGKKLRGGDLDSTLVAYLLDPEGRDYSLERLEASILGRSSTAATTGGPPPMGGGGEQKTCFDCRRLLELEMPLKDRLRKNGLERLYRELELPLTSILAEMEFTGVRIDSPFLNELSKQWTLELKDLEVRIYALAGEEFNIQSPRQLGQVLFQKLGLSPGRKTEKEKSFSTGVDVLEGLASSHPLPAAVLEYRGLWKLLSTYVESLPSLVNPETGRVHASFNQTTAATGRLSSSDPNLQNIPIRTEKGRQIRKAFIAQEGWRILTADYSQIELRVLAHLTQDEEMIRSFRNGEDIHQRTAAQIFGVAPDLVTPAMRHQAKTINFGILYGMGPFRLSRELGVSLASAKQYIEEYFQRFPGVRRYRDQVIESAERQGQVSTLLGRIRMVPEIRSRNMNQRNQGIRVAVNTTVQGSAADLIKAAMVQLDTRLKREALRSRLLIQVHDELVLESPEAEVGRASILVRESMEGCYPLDVPLVAEVRSGASWLETK
ncbi:MAG: DNA polymerase I [Acidobacteria bacterium]|nr:DNA polymerase I [Acidobacteriota bacterium]